MIIAKTGGRPGLDVGQTLTAVVESKKKDAELQQLSPEQILADNHENIQIAYSDITSVEMEKPGLIGYCHIKIHAKGTNKEYEFRLSEKKPVFQGRIDFFQSILKEKVIAK